MRDIQSLEDQCSPTRETFLSIPIQGQYCEVHVFVYDSEAEGPQ